MATTTTLGHVSRALDFHARTDLYFGIGRTTAWVDETNPPAEDVNAQALTEPIAYKKTGAVHIVVPDDVNGTIIYSNKKWRIVNAADAKTQGAHWVYVECWLNYDEVPLTNYRQVGVFSRLKPSAGNENDVSLLPTQVADIGILEVIDNRRVVSRQLDQREQLSIVIEF